MNTPDDTTIWNWLVGGAGLVIASALGLLYRQQQQTSDDLTQHRLDDVQKYALKTDVAELRDHVDDRFRSLLDEQAKGFGQVLDELKLLGRK